MKMKNCFIAVSSILLLSACGKDSASILVEAEFEPYYQRFVENSKAYGNDVSNESIEIKFVPELTDDRPNTIRLGVCYYGSASVEINQAAWPKLSIERREALIAHELGHCLLNRRHDDALDPVTGKKLSVMHSYLLSSVEFMNKYVYYMNELFTQPTNKNIIAFREDNPAGYTSPVANTASGIEESDIASKQIRSLDADLHDEDEVVFVVD